MNIKNLALRTYFFISLSLTLSFQLQAQTGDRIEEIITVATKIPTPASDVIGSVASISQEDIEIRMVNDLPQLLENTIGVSAPKGTYSGRARNEGIIIRGIGDSRVNLFIDGFRIADSYQSGGFGKDLVDTDLLKRVEILKGPSSAIYGSDGLAGTVSYTTKDPSDLASNGDSYNSFTIMTNSANNLSKYTILSAMVRNNFEALLQIGKTDMTEMSVHSDATETLNPMEGDNDSILAKIKYNFNESTNMTFTIDSQNSHSGYSLLTDEGFSFFPQIESVSESIGDDQMDRDRYSLVFNFEGNSNLFDSGSVRFFSQDTDQVQHTTKTKAVFVNGFAGPPTPMLEVKDYQFNQEISGLSFDMVKVAGRHSIVFGGETETAEFSRPKDRSEINLITQSVNKVFFGPEIFPNKAFPDSEVERKALYINDRVSLNERTTMVLGARYDSYDQKAKPDILSGRGNPNDHDVLPRSDSEVSVKLGFIYDISDSISLFAQYAEGYRNPDFNDAYNTYTNFAFGYTIVPNPSIKAEYSEGYEIGVRGRSGKYNWSLAMYQNDYEDFIQGTITGFIQGIMQYQYANLGEVETDGIEFELGTELTSNLYASIGASTADGKDGDNDLQTISPDELKINFAWTSDSGKIGVNFINRIVAAGPKNLPPSCGRSGCTNALMIDGRTTHDLYINYTLNENINFKVGIRNLTNEKYWDWVTVAGMSEGTADEYLYPGRNLSASFKISF